MAGWSETYRGAVMPWECDPTEHFTIGYYFDRIGVAALLIAEELGVEAAYRSPPGTLRFDARFVRELRAGASYHLVSAAIGLDGATLCIGHRVIDSAAGDTVTWIEQSLDLPDAIATPALRQAIASGLEPWEGPAVEPRPDPTSTQAAIPTARDRVRPLDLDETGRLSLGGFVHRFTAASLQSLAAIGLDAGYMQQQRRGYSTFELGLRIAAFPRLGDPILVETGITHLGGSSMRYLHRMSDPRTGREFARLGQFGVQLDLDARRPARFADELRARAARILLAAE